MPKASNQAQRIFRAELKNRKHRGVITSPMARNEVLSIMLIAEKMLKTPSQKIN